MLLSGRIQTTERARADGRCKYSVAVSGGKKGTDRNTPDQISTRTTQHTRDRHFGARTTRHNIYRPGMEHGENACIDGMCESRRGLRL